MTKEEALNILIANACCHYPRGMCEKCPWDGTYNCEHTRFSDVIEEAINMTLEDK